MPFRAAAVRTGPLPDAPPLRVALEFLTAVPPRAALAWAAIRAFRARVDFDAVIRASPPMISRLPLCARSLDTQRDRHLTQILPRESGLATLELARDQIWLSRDLTVEVQALAGWLLVSWQIAAVM